MKNTILALSGLLFVVPCMAQDILWDRAFGGAHAELLYDAVPTADYGFLLAGSSVSGKSAGKTSESQGDFDYWLWKMDEHGEMDWQKSFGGFGQDLLKNVKLTNDGGFILGGVSDSASGGDKKHASMGGYDYWVIKLNAGGGEQWQRTIGGAGSDDLTAVIKTKDGGYVLAGSSASGISGDKTYKNFGGTDFWIVKLSSDGTIEWQQSYGGNFNDELKHGIQTRDGGFVLVGYSTSGTSGNKLSNNNGQGDGWIIKLDALGRMEWEENYGGNKEDSFTSVVETHEGDLVVGGYSNSGATHNKRTSSRNGSDFWVLRLTSTGQNIWQESYDIGAFDVLNTVLAQKEGGFLLGGHAKSSAKSNSAGIGDYVMISINAKGEEQWRKEVGSNGADVLKGLIETRDGGYILAGTSKGAVSGDKSAASGEDDFWIVKLRDKIKPEKAKQNIEAIPNPASGYTNAIVGYDFEYGDVTLFDINGRMLSTSKITTGRTVPVSLQGLPDGVYLIEIRTNVSKDAVKVIKQSN